MGSVLSDVAFDGHGRVGTIFLYIFLFFGDSKDVQKNSAFSHAFLLK